MPDPAAQAAGAPRMRSLLHHTIEAATAAALDMAVNAYFEAAGEAVLVDIQRQFISGGYVAFIVYAT